MSERRNGYGIIKTVHNIKEMHESMGSLIKLCRENLATKKKKTLAQKLMFWKKH